MNDTTKEQKIVTIGPDKKRARVYVIIGGCWGDEGKGKVAAFYSANADLVIRATGGANAGHTIYINGKKIALHLVPGGIGNPKAISLIGQGTVIDFDILVNEINELYEYGIEDVMDRLKISGTANVLFPYHKALDKLHEWLRSNKVGTTAKGIGPAYADETTRFGLKVYDLLLPVEELTEKIREVLSLHKPLFSIYNKWWKKEAKMETKRKKKKSASWMFTAEEWTEYMDFFSHPEKLAIKYHEYAKQFSKSIVNGHHLVQSFLTNPEKVIVVEGAQSVCLSLKEGHYPMVTSSDANTLGTLSGAHLSHKDPTEVILIAKGYFSKVGQGIFPTEFESHIGADGKLIAYNKEDAYEGDIYRDENGEYGATTKRPRRTGAFDGVLLKNSVQKSGADYLCINCIDSIGYMGKKYGKIKICYAYDYQGREIDYWPDNINLTCEIPTPKYLTFDGGWEITKAMKTYEDFPTLAKTFIQIIEKITGCQVKYIGVGPKNEDMVIREDL